MRLATACAATAVAAAACKGRDQPEPAGREKTIGGVGDVELLAAGDVIVGEMLARRAAQAEKEWAVRYPYRGIADRVRRADVAIANLETVLSGRGEPMKGRAGARAEPRTAEGLMRAGFDVMSLANDHVLDWGEEALRDTARNLRAWDVAPVGLRSRAAKFQDPQIVRVHGMPIAFLAYTAVFPQAYRERFPGPFPAIPRNMAADVRRARARAEAVVVSIHFGREWDLLPTDRQREIAKAARDAGAAVVVGHGARVVQPLEAAGEQATAFGLGALVIDGWPQPWAARARRAALLSVKFVKRRVASATLEPVAQGGDLRPDLGGDLDVASLATPFAPPGAVREDLLARLAGAAASRGGTPCAKFRPRPPSDGPVHEHFDCGGGALRAVGRGAMLSGGAWREVVGAALEPGAAVAVHFSDPLVADAFAGYAGLDDGAPGPAEITVKVDHPDLAPTTIRLDRPGWQPLRIGTPGLAGRRLPVEVRAAASGRARVGFRLWSVKE